jgi:hypothetical protein
MTNRFRYRITGRGDDYVDIVYPGHPLRNEPITSVEGGKTNIIAYGAVSSDERIHFTADGTRLWVGEEPANRVWRRRVVAEPGGPADGSRPFSSETNRTPGAAASRR